MKFLWSIKDRTFREEVFKSLKAINGPSTYQHRALVVFSTILGDNDFSLDSRILKLLEPIKCEPVLVTRAIQDVNAMAEHIGEKMTPVYKAVIEFWNKVAAFMLKYCENRTEALDAQYDQLFEALNAETFDIERLYDSLYDFNLPDELSAIIKSNFEWQKSIQRPGLSERLKMLYDFAQIFMMIFEKMHGQGLKGLLLGTAKSEC